MIDEKVFMIVDDDAEDRIVFKEAFKSGQDAVPQSSI